MNRQLAVLMMVATLAAGEILVSTAAAEMPMSPVYPTASRPKRQSPAAQPTAVAVPSTAEKPIAPAGSSGDKQAAVTPAKDAATGPVFEATIPPPEAAAESKPPTPEAAEAPPPPPRKTEAKRHHRRPARAPRYAYSPYGGYPAWSPAYADPQRGWGGGRYGPTPMSDGQ